jgi:hypothetical protein
LATQNFRVKNGLEVGIGATILFADSSGNIGIGTTDPTKALHVVGDTFVTGVVTATTFVGDVTGDVTGVIGGVASTATALENARDFSITGDFVTASAVSFDGTGNVALAATIAPDSVVLGTYTSGDYVQSITGTSNEIEITGGTGEGSTPTIGLPNDVTISNDLTVTRDLQVTRNLNVDGNITVGGTTATIIAQTLEIGDADLILGVRTDANGNDVATDNTANHGGIAIASTEGTPLVTIVNPGAGETLPSTYKKIMWFKTGSFSGLGTDAWLANYAVGIGSTQVPYGTRLSAGNVQITNDDISVVRDIDASGIITASSFEGDGSSLTSVNATTLDSIDSTSFLRSDAADTKTGITTFSDTTVFDGDVELNGNITTNVTIVSTDAGSSAAPEFKLYRNSASPADADYLGQIKFAGESDTGVERNYAKITGKISDATNGTEDGIIEIAHIKDGSQNISARWNSSELQLLNGTELSLGDSQKIYLGAGNDLQIYHDGTDDLITSGGATLKIAGSRIVINNAANNENQAVFTENGAVELYYDNTKKFETTGYGVTVSGGAYVSGVSTFQGNVNLGDNTEIRIGDATNGDLALYHDGSNSYIADRGTGDLVISATHLRLRSAAAETYLLATANGSVELYYDAVKKFETTGYGVTVSGGLNVSGVSTFQSDVVASSTLTVGDTTGISGEAPTDEGVLAVYTSGGKNALIVQTSDNSQSRGIAFRNSADAYIGYISIENVGSNLGDMVFGVSNTTESNIGNVDERVRFTKDGDVGIGTDSPTAKLDVDGTLNVSGIATATSFVGDLTGDVTGNADTATNIAGGDAGDIPYQSAADTTTFVDASSAVNGQVLLWNGSAPVWDNVTAASGAFGGITIQDEGSTVGTANSIKTIDFVGSNIVATATTGANGISTVTLSDTPTFDSLTVTGDVSIADKIVHTGDTNTAIRFPAADTFTVETAGSERLRVGAGGSVGIGTDNPSDKLHVQGDIRIDNPGADSEIIFGTDTNGVRLSRTNGTFDLNLVQGTSSNDGLYLGSAGNVYVSIDTNNNDNDTKAFIIQKNALQSGTELARFTESGRLGIGTDNPTAKLDVDGTLNVSGVSTFQGNVNLPDDVELTFGNSPDLKIYHDGGNASYIRDVGTGNLNIDSTGGNIQIRVNGSESAIIANQDGEVELYYDNAKKFETTGYGVTVTGGVHVSGVVTSTVSTGTAPFVVASTTKVTNLNADLLDGKSTANGASGNTVVIRNAAGGFDASDVNFANITASGDLNVSGIITASTFVSNVSTGTSPLTVTSKL